MTRKHESGQALVLVLLSLAVVLTIVLFILARSITDVAVSSRQEEAVRAFSAAEAGIEKALVIGSSISQTDIGNASYNATVTGFAEGQTSFIYPNVLFSGDSITTWFIAHEGSTEAYTLTGSFAGSQMQICWGAPGTAAGGATSPAVELSVYYKTAGILDPSDFSSVLIGRATFDPNATRSPANYFSAVAASSCDIAGTTFAFQKTISFADLGIPAATYTTPGGLLFARIRILYNTDAPHPIGVNVSFPGNSVLPSQGPEITSTGTAGVSNRRISVFQGWPESPFGSNAIFTPQGLTK